jgi:protocatechuate 3,4-dioxygenase beta subunit
MARRTSSVTLLLAVSAALAAQDAGRPASVDGMVIDGITGAPLPHARVVLTATQNRTAAGARSYGAITGDDGKFSWDSVQPGDYTFGVSLRGFIRSDYRSRAFEVVVKPDSATHDLRWKLVPAAAIAGRVVDSHGNPVEQADVTAALHNTRQTLKTDDRGEFRFTGMAAGRYLLSAAPPEDRGAAEIRTDGTREECHALSWFPNTLEKRDAAPLEVAAGAEVNGIEIRLVRIPIVRVAGSVTGVVGTNRVSVLVSTQDEIQPRWVSVPNGKFSIWRLPPGQYTLQATGRVPDDRGLASVRLTIDVADANIDGLTLDAIPEFELAGQVEWDGTPPASRQLEGATLFFDHSPEPTSAKIAADGSFRAPHALVGKQRVKIAGTPGNVYLKSIWLGTTEMPDRELDLRSDPKEERLTVMLSTGAAQVSGIAQSGSDPIPGADICIAADRENARCEQSVQSGADGSFTIGGLAPGKYKLYVSDLGGQPGSNPVEAIELHEGEKATRNLTMAK